MAQDLAILMNKRSRIETACPILDLLAYMTAEKTMRQVKELPVRLLYSKGVIGNDHLHYISRAFQDFINLAVSQNSGDRVLIGVSVSAQDLQGKIRHGVRSREA